MRLPFHACGISKWLPRLKHSVACLPASLTCVGNNPPPSHPAERDPCQIGSTAWTALAACTQLSRLRLEHSLLDAYDGFTSGIPQPSHAAAVLFVFTVWGWCGRAPVGFQPQSVHAARDRSVQSTPSASLIIPSQPLPCRRDPPGSRHRCLDLPAQAGGAGAGFGGGKWAH